MTIYGMQLPTLINNYHVASSKIYWHFFYHQYLQPLLLLVYSIIFIIINQEVKQIIFLIATISLVTIIAY